MRNLTLLTDFYEITMAYGFFKEGKHEEEVVFDLFFRRNKHLRRMVPGVADAWSVGNAALFVYGSCHLPFHGAR